MVTSNALRTTAILLSIALATAQTDYFGSTYSGDGTYYGDQSGSGHCSFQFSNSFTLPWTTGVYTGVAMNAPQYANSNPCGMCVAFWGTGPGSGANPISTTAQYAIVSDECPECLTGSLDVAQDGDGRWSIDWYPVQCAVGTSSFQYSFQGSNENYVKMGVTNTRVPVAAASIALPDGTLQAMSKTVDNYWLATSGPYTFPAAVSLTSVFGDIVTDTVNVASPTGAVAGKAQFPLNSAYETVGGASSTTPSSPATEASPAVTAAATSAPTPEPTTGPTLTPTPVSVATAEPTPEPTAEPTTAPAAQTTIQPTTEPAATAVAASPSPAYASATSNYSVNSSAPAPPVPASAEVTPVPILVPASTQTVSAVVSNITNAATPTSTAAVTVPTSVSPVITASSTPDGDSSLVSTPASCTLSVAALQQCGGRGGVCANQATNGSQCADAQWGNACCTSGYYCQRQQQWSWTCQRTETPGVNTSVSDGGVVADYKQCGGLGNCAQSLCADSMWENYSCYGGFTCLRWDAFYWQCRDIPFAEQA